MRIEHNTALNRAYLNIYDREKAIVSLKKYHTEHINALNNDVVNNPKEGLEQCIFLPKYRSYQPTY